MKGDEIEGYFVYKLIHGKLTHYKYHKRGDLASADTKRYWEEGQVAKHPLTQEEFENWSLAALTLKYPPPALAPEESRVPLT